MISVASMQQRWSDFFFKPESTKPIAVFRICIGLLVLNACFLLWGDLYTWFGPASFVPRRWVQGGFPDLFAILPADRQSVTFVFFLLVISALMVTVGYLTRFSTVVLWLALMAMNNANPFIFNGGDGLLRISSFFLMFSPCDKSLSLDKVLRRRSQTPAEFNQQDAQVLQQPELASPWAQRLIQIQIALVYWQAFWGKTVGAHWQDGTAVYYVTHLTELQRIQIPFIFNNLLLCRIFTWGTLLFEGAFWSLIWFKPLRYPLLITGIALHLGIDIAINLPIFSWAMISSYILFCEPAAVQRCLDWINRILSRVFPKAMLRTEEQDSAPTYGVNDT